MVSVKENSFLTIENRHESKIHKTGWAIAVKRIT